MMKVKGKLVLILLIVFAGACDKNSINNSEGSLVTHTLCKNEKDLEFDTGESCVEYNYNTDEKILNLKHINTTFNCCPEKLYCNISFSGDTIIIEEFERKQECNCLCLYDMEMEVYEVERRTYFLKFIEPYLGSQEELFFEIDLSFNTSGLYCVDRVNYPWGF